MKKLLALFLAAAMAVPVTLTASAATTVTNGTQLAAAADGGGEIVLGGSFAVDQLLINSNVTIDGAGHTLTGANTNLSQATIANRSDGLAVTFKNIVLDGGGQVKTDTCLWMGRGSWDWYDVTVQNWNSSSSGNRGALTLGKSANSPGVVNMHGAVITDNHLGLSLDQSETVANVYGCIIEGNERADVNITAGTLNLIDDDEKSEKRIGKLIMSGGTLNIGGNTSVSQIEKNGGTINITGNITSDSVTEISLPSYDNMTVAARLQGGADSSVLEHFVLSGDAPEGCGLEIIGSSLLVTNPNDDSQGIEVAVDYSRVLGESTRLASGSLHAMDYKTPAQWLTDGVIMNTIRGQAHQKEFDSNYEYLPGFFDQATYDRVMENNPDTKLMIGLYYGFKPQYGNDWQNAALENGGSTWKAYIAELMREAEGKEVYSWIPWNEPDLQWGGKFTTDFRTAYRYAYEAVKAYDPDALVQAPETCRYSFSDLTGFLTYCKENDCLPDVLAWHELTASRSDTEAHCKELYKWLIENNIEPMPFAVTEYQGTGYGTDDSTRINQGTYNPGLSAAYIAGMERAEKYGFRFGLKSAWGLSGSNPDYQTDLGQMADFANGNMPTGLWYVYNAYRLMSGVKVEAAADYTQLECFATTDAGTDAARSVVLLGNWESEDKITTVKLNNIPEYLTHNGKIHIEAELIRETLATANYGTEVLISGDMEVQDGSCSITLPVEGRSAVVVKITPSTDAAAETAASELEYTVTGAMTAETGDVLTVTGGRPSSYTNPDASAPMSDKTYVETGDRVGFTVEVQNDGLYNLSVSHRKGPENGFVQLYADDVSFGTPTDMYAADSYDFTKNYGSIYLAAGTHTLSFRLVGTGKNEASGGYGLTFGSFTLSEIVPDGGNILSFDCADSIYAGETANYLPVPEKEGYTFMGWKTADGQEITTGSAITGDTELYAEWKENSGSRVKVYVAGGQANIDEAYVDGGESLEITLTAENDLYVPSASANGQDVSQNIVKTEEGYSLTLDITQDTTVFVAFGLPYGFDTAYSRADYRTLDLNDSYTDFAFFEYSLTPLALNEGYVGFCGSGNTPNNWASFNISVRMTTDGAIEARNGGSYGSVGGASYEVGKTYRISIAVDVKNKKYSAWLFDEDGTRTTIAEDYAFRSDAPATDNISKVCVNAGYNEAAQLFCIEGFRELADFEISSCDSETGTVVVSAVRPENAVLICAGYADGRLEEVETMEVSLEAGENTFTLESLKGGEKTVMLWEDLSDPSPLCEKKVF